LRIIAKNETDSCQATECCIRRISPSNTFSTSAISGLPKGVAKTSSHTNTTLLPEEDVNQPAPRLFSKQFGAKMKKTITNDGVWRVASHVLVVAGAIFVVAAGKIQAESITGLKSSGRGATSTEDQSTTLAAGAILAEQSHSLIAADVKERAVTVAGQAKLATTGESCLYNRAPIASGGVANRTVSIHAVATGETVSTIAQQYGITSDTVLWANNLEADTVLKAGAQLTILPVNGLLYAVSGNETLEELASRFQSSANLIDSFNQLEGKPLAAGQKLIIPDGVKPAPADPDPAPVARLASVAAKPVRTIASFKPSFGSNGYTRGYCTYYVASRRGVPSSWGNASQWYYNAIASGYAVGSSPRPGAIAQTSGGWGGYGHVAYVEGVSGGMVTVSEMNYNGGWNRVSRRTVPASSFRYIY
jgi:surface antigen